MRTVDRLTRCVCALLPALLLLLAGCAGDPAERGSGSGADGPVTVRALMNKDPASVSLIGKTDRNADTLAVQITDSLVQYDSQLVFVPRLAESWSFSDDHRSVTFKLRPGVRWHDGQELTSADVAFTLQLVRRPEVENRTYAPLFADMESVTTPDPLTVVVRFSRADPDILDAFRVPIVPAHRIDLDGDFLTGEFARHPIGCGPFRFVSYRPGEEIVLEANDDYWDGRPFIDRLVFRIFPEHATAYQAMLKGDLDTMVAVPELYRQALEADTAGRLAGLVFYRLSVWQIIWNLDGSNPFFDDVRVRKAMILATDRDSFNRSVVHGLGRLPASIYHQELPWHDPDLLPLPYDPDAARELLEQAGWLDRDGDGVRERSGRELEFTLMIIASSQKLNDHMAAWLQQSWAEVGARVQIEKLEWLQFRERRNSHQFMAAMGGVGLTTNPGMYPLYHSEAVDQMNYGRFADAEVDHLIESSRRIFDPAERQRSVRQLERRLFELQPAAWLFNFPSPLLHDRRLQGIRTSPVGHWATSEGPRLWRWSETRPEQD